MLTSRWREPGRVLAGVQQLVSGGGADHHDVDIPGSVTGLAEAPGGRVPVLFFVISLSGLVTWLAMDSS
jgi:hypothetical protein